ncbi:MAG: NAD-dependent dihydropyrimidine dehydrogenase, PreA subunit [Chloroflexi bacterium]|jgi:NAD-dependent dihydropyrimidine dehydrogenase PreA subunit|nr:MAG: NAD-dependent dihydropyrimidine dehydrogenase, PreA subunit [Chloroflexota bacterium]
MFIKVRITPGTISGRDLVKKLVEVCPVDIFAEDEGDLLIVEENQDECTLCNLCIEAAPEGAVQIIKLYED